MSGAKVQPIRPAKAATVDSETMDSALRDQRRVLFQAMGIVRLATHAIREEGSHRAITDAWTALDGAYTLLSSVADRVQTTETMLASEVFRGEY